MDSQGKKQLTIKYPPIHPVTTILIATATLALPKQWLTAVGIVEKKAPFAAPLITTNTTIGASVVDCGHTAMLVTAVRISDANTVLRDPSLSDMTPEPMRPNADARLKPATSPAPVLDEKPRDLVKRGMKKGGTKRGNVPMALPKKTRTKVKERKRDLERGVSFPHPGHGKGDERHFGSKLTIQ